MLTINSNLIKRKQSDKSRMCDILKATGLGSPNKSTALKKKKYKKIKRLNSKI